MGNTAMMVACGIEQDEDGEYLSVSTPDGTKRVRFVEFGEEASNGSMQFLPVRAFGPRKDGTIQVVMRDALDKRAASEIYTVSQDDVISEEDFRATLDHCGGLPRLASAV